MGRADRKFCCIDCKDEHHNANKRREREQTKTIIAALVKNRRILESLAAGERMTYADKDQMLQMGFDFNYHTHHSGADDANEYIMCFDYGYTLTANGRVNIAKWPHNPYE